MDAMDRVKQVIRNGKIQALEAGLVSGSLDAVFVRGEANKLLQEEGVTDEQRERLQVLAQSGITPPGPAS